jgi:hypothetical protein
MNQLYRLHTFSIAIAISVILREGSDKQTLLGKKPDLLTR